MVVVVMMPPAMVVMVVVMPPAMMVMMVVPLRDLHFIACGRGPLLVRSLQDSRGVRNRLQELSERTCVHGPIDFIGRHGRLRHRQGRDRTHSRYQDCDFFIHPLLLELFGWSGRQPTS
jgi:hypothetical protein